MALGSLGVVEYKQDFIGWDIVADQPEVAVDTDPAVEVVAAGIGGVVRITMDAGQTNIGGILFGQTQWNPVDHGIYVEARVRLSAIGTGAERVGVWLTDLQEDTLSEYPFTQTTSALTAVADPNDAVGIFWEGDSALGWVAASQNADSLVVDGISNGTARVSPVANKWDILTFEIAKGGKDAVFAVNGTVIAEYHGTTPVIADVPVIPVFGATEGTTAINADIDYIIVRGGREDD